MTQFTIERGHEVDRRTGEVGKMTAPAPPCGISVALLSAGADRPYTFDLAMALMSKGVGLDVIGGNDLDDPEFHDKPDVNFFNLRGSQRTDVSFVRKMFRVLAYYVKLVRYAATAKPKIFHILWNNKFETFDRTLLMLYYRFLGKKIVLTVHNVNARKRDLKDRPLNRLTLRIQYHLADHMFVHTQKMGHELAEEFGVQPSRITVIPFGINQAIPNTSLTTCDAKRKLGILDTDKTMLFFGHIAPYKGLEYLVTAFKRISAPCKDYRLIIAGGPKNCERYWTAIREDIKDEIQSGRILLKPDYIPDKEAEVYFKAADVTILPYRHIYQSGVLFLAQSFGLPVIAADVGSLKDDIVEGMTGFVFAPEDPVDLANAIERYFASELYANLNNRRQEIRDFATERHSWDIVGKLTCEVYGMLLGWMEHAPRRAHSSPEHPMLARGLKK